MFVPVDVVVVVDDVEFALMQTNERSEFKFDFSLVSMSNGDGLKLLLDAWFKNPSNPSEK